MSVLFACEHTKTTLSMVYSRKNGSNVRILNSAESGRIAVVSPGMKMECMSVTCARLHSLNWYLHVMHGAYFNHCMILFFSLLSFFLICIRFACLHSFVMQMFLHWLLLFFLGILDTSYTVLHI